MEMNRPMTFIVAVFLLTRAGFAAADEGIPTENQFLEKIKPLAERLEQFYLISKSKSTYITHAPDLKQDLGKIIASGTKGGRVTVPYAKQDKQELSFLGDGKKYRLEQSLSNGITYAYMSSPEGSFRLRKMPNSLNFLVDEIYNTNLYREKQKYVIRGLAVSVTRPYSILNERVDRFLSQGKFKIENMTQFNQDDRRVTRLSWQLSRNGGAAQYFGDTDFLTDQGWAIKESSTRWIVHRPGKSTVLAGSHSFLEYDRTEGGLPVLKSVKSYAIAENGVEWLTRELDVEEFQSRGAREGDFKLASFGVMVEPISAPRPAWFNFFWLAVAAAAAAALLRVVRGRLIARHAAS